MLRSILLMILAFTCFELFAQKVRIYSGPMQGHTTDTTLSIWLMSGQKQALTYSLIHDGEPVSAISSKQVIQPDNCWHRLCPVTLQFLNLAPDTKYELSINNKSDTILFNRTFSTLRTPDALQPEDFEVLTGSCFMRGTGGLTNLVDNKAADGIYDAMKKDTSDLMLWLGDNLYYLFEFISDRGMRRKNIETRLLPEIQGLITSRTHYSIWDDHEFGPNDSDGSFKRKEAASRIFKAFWPNPTSVNDGGTNYYSFKREDAEFFMLDDRYLSVRSEDAGTHRIIDSVQITWLKNSLLNSTATFKILCLGSQWFNDKRTDSKNIFQGSEGSADFLQFLSDNHIEGVFLISGDVHYNMLQKIPREGAYPLFELTSSAVSSWPNKGPEKWPGSLSSYTVPGTLYTGNNYSTLSFSGQKGSRTILVRTFDTGGRLVWERTISEGELKF